MTFWTADRVDELRRLAPDFTATEIAKCMGATRNAVLGKMFRLGISQDRPTLTLAERQDRRRAYMRARHAAKRQLVKPRPERKTRFHKPPELPAEPLVTLAPADAPPPRNLSLLDLATGDCHYPVNDGPPFAFCGHPVWNEGKSYCAAHHRIAHDRSRDQRSA